MINVLTYLVLIIMNLAIVHGYYQKIRVLAKMHIDKEVLSRRTDMFYVCQGREKTDYKNVFIQKRQLENDEIKSRSFLYLANVLIVGDLLWIVVDVTGVVAYTCWKAYRGYLLPWYALDEYGAMVLVISAFATVPFVVMVALIRRKMEEI